MEKALFRFGLSACAGTLAPDIRRIETFTGYSFPGPQHSKPSSRCLRVGTGHQAPTVCDLPSHRIGSVYDTAPEFYARPTAAINTTSGIRPASTSLTGGKLKAWSVWPRHWRGRQVTQHSGLAYAVWRKHYDSGEGLSRSISL